MIIGIVGAGEDKFTKETRLKAKSLITQIIIKYKNETITSGDSPVGGIDKWTREIAEEFGCKFVGRTPEIDPSKGHPTWDYGYGFKARNLDIANADEVYVIVVKEYPSNYNGQRFKECYHCKGRHEPHIKSGGCYTGWKAIEKGHKAIWYFL